VAVHSDPIAPVIFGISLIVAEALAGRFAARKLEQPSVLGEPVVGVLLGNLLYWLHYDPILVLREGTLCLDMSRRALSGMSWQDAAVSVLGPEEGPRLLELLRGPHRAA
jgi:Kef-type K+ transport system membrane component KefB